MALQSELWSQAVLKLTEKIAKFDIFDTIDEDPSAFKNAERSGAS